MGQRLLQVDAFTAHPFSGNPAAVCVMSGAAPDSWMQNVAREMNLSESAFLHREDEHWRLRWFTPGAEVALCGHATLASAHVLWEEGHLRADEQARFQTRSGLLTADKEGEWIRLDFPTTLSTRTEVPAGMLEALGVRDVLYVGKNVFDYVVEIESEEQLRSLNPDFGQLAGIDARGVVVTSRSDKYDFVSRFFGPAVGVPEDPVTGSAHCALTPYWAQKLGKNEMTAFQASARGGILKVSLRGDRVWIAGQAVTVLRGELIDTPPMP